MEKDEIYWRDYRRKLTKELNIINDVEKNSKNIYDMAKRIGVKPTARYFGIDPSNVRYHIKKIEKDSNK